MAIVLICTRGLLADQINVSAAVSLKEAMTDIARSYEAGGQDHVVFTFGASGQLAAQIKNGAPADVFISAANKEVDDLTHMGLVEAGSRRVVAGNALVLIAPSDSRLDLSSFEKLTEPDAKRIAIGEPRSVPAGQYAMQVLTGMKLADELRPRLTYGSSVRHVLDYVERGEVSAGIVYATDAIQAGAKVKVVAVAKASMHEPIVYPAVIISNSTRKIAAAKFIDYIDCDKGRAALASRGFTRGVDVIAATAPKK